MNEHFVTNPFGLEKCTHAGNWINGRPAITPNEVCGNGTFWAFDVGRVTYPNQTQLCNSWVNFTGHPCLVVHT
jgi:hypothetical protein